MAKQQSLHQIVGWIAVETFMTLRCQPRSADRRSVGQKARTDGSVDIASAQCGLDPGPQLAIDLDTQTKLHYTLPITCI